MDAESQFELERQHMVGRQLRGRGIRDERVLNVMAGLPRERFIPEESRYLAYEDRPVPIGFGQTISQPYIVALMTQELDVEPTHRVLDVGSGSGYQAAILAKLAQEVLGIERIPELAERAKSVLAELNLTNAEIFTGDGTLGLPKHAPFDRIICGAAGPDVPQAWIEQLAQGGRLVMPTGSPEHQVLIAVEKAGVKTIRREICPVSFVPLIGRQGWQR